MAWEIPVLDISLVAADDLQDFQYFFVKVNSDGEVELAGDGEAALGVLQNKPGEATGAGGEAASIRIRQSIRAKRSHRTLTARRRSLVPAIECWGLP